MTEPMRKEYAKLRRKPFLTPVWLTATVGLVLLAVLVWAALAASTTTIFVIRHAEAVAGTDKDPPLSLAGELRAARLAEWFGAAPAGLRLDGIVVTELRRTQETARPLANQLGIPVIVVPATDPKAAARRALREFPGGRVLVIGHSDTVPEIVRALSGKTVPPISESEFGLLYVVAKPRHSRPAVSQLRLP